jgi:hypothetical protein
VARGADTYGGDQPDRRSSAGGEAAMTGNLARTRYLGGTADGSFDGRKVTMFSFKSADP